MLFCGLSSLWQCGCRRRVGRPPIGQICSILYSAIIIYALHFARKHPELKRFWMPDALLAAMSLFPGAAQINMVSNTCRAEGSDCDPAVITQGTLALTAGAVITVHSAPARALYLVPHLIVYPCVLAGDPDAYPWDPDTFPWSDRLPTTVPVALLVVAWAMVCARERLQRQQWYRATKELEAALAKQAVLERVIAEQDAMLAIPLSPKTPVDESFKGGMFVSRTEGSFDYEAVLKNCGEVEEAAFKILKAFDPQPPLDAIEEVLRSLVDGAGAATIYVEAHKLKRSCKSLCAAEAQAAALHLEQAAKECAPSTSAARRRPSSRPPTPTSCGRRSSRCSWRCYRCATTSPPASGRATRPETVRLFGSPS